MRPHRLKAKTVLIQAVSLIVALVLGCVIFAAKSAAQSAPAVRSGGPGGGGGGLGGAAHDAGSLAAAPAGGAPSKAAPSGDAGADAGVEDLLTPVDGGSVLDDAVIQGDEDLPAELSEEQRAALGMGKVPIHRKGDYRSAFANPSFGGPAHVKVGLVLVDVREFDIQTGAFQADFFLSLMSDKRMPDVHLVFTNGKDVNETALLDSPTLKVFRYTGTFVTAVDLRSYPFDSQRLDIEIEDQKAGVDQVIFEPYPDRTSLDEGFVISGWAIGSVGAHAYKHLYPSRFDRDDLYVSRYKFTLSIDRFAVSAAFSVFVPAYIIVLISLMGMWVPPDELEVRSNAGAPMLAAAVFFHYSLIQSLPATGYLTRADKLMLGVYLSLAINMASTWALLIVDEERIEWLFRWARTWVPIATVVLMAAASLL